MLQLQHKQIQKEYFFVLGSPIDQRKYTSNKWTFWIDNSIEERLKKIGCFVQVSAAITKFRMPDGTKYNQQHFRTMEHECKDQTKVFDSFIRSISHLINHDVLSHIHKKYYIKEFKIEEINVTSAASIYAGIVAKYKKSQAAKNELSWLENELRIFVWVLTFYAQSSHLQIQNFTEAQWQFFLTLFPNKQKILFEYQAFSLLKNHNQYKKWEAQQDQMFQQLIKKEQYKLKWSDLGKGLFIESDRKYFRTPKQCRERWLNHLDPSKTKKGWLQQEDFMIIENVKFYGKKWANISKKLQNRRNQHSIKNRFKSLMTKESKLYSRIASEKQLVDSLYCSLLANNIKNHSQRELSQQIRQNEQNMSNQKQYKQYLPYDFESDRSEEYFFDYSDHSSMFQNQRHFNTEFLCNISFNLNQNLGLKKISQELITQDKHIFDYSKIQNPFLKNNGNTLQSLQEQKEEKRIIVDLFVQEDPFEMLKSYIYLPSSSQ